MTEEFKVSDTGVLRKSYRISIATDEDKDYSTEKWSASFDVDTRENGLICVHCTTHGDNGVFYALPLRAMLALVDQLRSEGIKV